MKEDERINLLQQELEDLQRRLAQQQHEVERMKRQLGNLAGQKQEVHGVAPGDASSWSLENFIGLRLIHFIGIIVLVVGLSIGVKYAIDRNLISEGLRIGLAYGAGAILYGLSLRLRNKYVLFSAILFSGGMASVYFTTYAAHVYYSIFSFAFAFILMVLLTVYTVYEAMRYSRQEIALLGLVGAYGIPFLISANSDRPELFFIYISLINLGVAFLFIKRSWRQVNWAAQLLTWVLFIGWASMGQTAGTKEQGIFFMCFFFLLFAASSVAFKISGKRRFIDADVWQICFSNAGLYIAALFIIGYSLNAGIAIITLSSSVLISLQVWFVLKYWKEELFLRKLLFTMALIMFVFFIFFNWDGFTVTLLWLLTAVVVFVCGFLKKSVSMRMLAIVLMGITLAKLLMLDSLSFGTIQKVIAYLVLGTLLLGVSFFYQKFKEQIFGRKH